MYASRFAFRKASRPGKSYIMIKTIPMKILFVTLFVLFYSGVFAQVLIHAHNDYEKPLPLTNALSNRVYSVEADVFLKDTVLVVAHTKSQIRPQRTLDSLYIQPLVSLFKSYKGYVSSDTGYRVALVIDIKEKPEQVLKYLRNLIELNRKYFDRSMNPNAVQVIISGDRGAIKDWTSYPDYLYLDGRPNESYDENTLKKVALISDNFQNYAAGSEPTELPEKLKTIVQQVHQRGKPLRLWAAPDNEAGWFFLRKAGVDILNTDKVGECRQFFRAKK